MASSEHFANVPAARPHGHPFREDETCWRGVGEKRSHIAGELHDGLFCHLPAAALRLQNASETLLSESTLGRTLADDLCADLRAAEVQTVGGSPCGVQVIFDETVPLLATRTRWELVRISQEALRNAVRHGCARTVEVRLDHLASECLVRLCVRDDGCGFDPSAPGRPDGSGHFGLHGMRSRAERLGGWFTVASKPGTGTVVTAAVPVTLLPIRPSAVYWPVVNHPALDH